MALGSSSTPEADFTNLRRHTRHRGRDAARADHEQVRLVAAHRTRDRARVVARGAPRVQSPAGGERARRDPASAAAPSREPSHTSAFSSTRPRCSRSAAPTRARVVAAATYGASAPASRPPPKTTRLRAKVLLPGVGRRARARAAPAARVVAARRPRRRRRPRWRPPAAAARRAARRARDERALERVAAQCVRRALARRRDRAPVTSHPRRSCRV